MPQLSVGTDTVGQHGYIPPTADIGRTVEAWLPWALRTGIATMPAENAPDPDEHTDYTVHVKCYRKPAAHGFIGVKAVCVPYDCSLELRVRPPGSQWQWPCVLTCPTTDLAVALFSASRPEAAQYIMQQVVQTSGPTEVIVVPRLSGYRLVSKQPRKDRVAQQIGRDVINDNALALFSYLVMQQIAASQCPHVTATQVARYAITAIGRSNVAPEMAATAVMPLVIVGALDPTPSSNGQQHFLPTMLTTEYAAKHARRLEELERKRLEGACGSAQQLLDASRRRQGQLAAQLTTEQATEESISTKLTALRTQLAALPTPEEDDI